MPKTRKTMKRKTMKKRWGGAPKKNTTMNMKDLQSSLYNDVEASLPKQPRAAVLKARLTSALIRKNQAMKSSKRNENKKMKQMVDDLSKMFKNL